jgi:hypothetical protein
VRRRTFLQSIAIALSLTACNSRNQVALDSQEVPPPSATAPAWFATVEARWTTSPDAPIPAALAPTKTLAETPSAVPISTAGPAREVLLEFGSTGGDGGTSYDVFFGRDVPSVVLYADGLLIMTEQETHDQMSFLHKQLTDSEICDLLQAFSATGFFEAPGTGQSYPDDPIYKSNDYYGDGAGGTIIEINGPRNKFVWIYRPAIDNLVPPVAAANMVATSYRPSGLQPFDSHRVIIIVERMPGEDWLGPTPGPSAPWSTDLPPHRAHKTDPG